MAITTKATYYEPDQFAHGRISFFTVTADLTAEADLATFVQAATTVCTIIQLGEADATDMRFAVENNGVTASELSTVTGETVSDFTL